MKGKSSFGFETKQTQESMNRKLGHVKLCSLRNGKKEKKKNQQSLRDLGDTIKHTNTHNGRKGEKGAESIFEVS